MKRRRQNAIIKLIKDNNIETQEELTKLLCESGFNTTQATVSRDIKELKLTKITYDGNRHKYVISDGNDAVNLGSYQQVLTSSIVSIDHAENIIVVKTVSGMAMAVGAAIDNINIQGILGCIAGDDTLFLAIKHSSMAGQIIGEIKNVAKYAY